MAGVLVIGPSGHFLGRTSKRVATIVVRRKRAIWLNVNKIQMLMTKKDRTELYHRVIEEAGYWCQLCNGHICGGTIAPEDATVDHLVPLSHGGTDLRENLVCASHHCNQLKRDMSLEEFQNRYLKGGG